jgi:catalase
MTFEQAEKFRWNPFDLTKIWPQTDFPRIPVGKLVLNRNPSNYFAEVEQVAFSPAHMVPGIEPSPDKMLQGRLFSYDDTHRHRLGANYHQIPVNCPYAVRSNNYQRDGPMNVDGNQGGAPNYFPNSFNGPIDDPVHSISKTTLMAADVKKYNTRDDDNFSQVTNFWLNVLSREERERLVFNIASHLKDAQGFIQERAVRNFSEVHPDYGGGIAQLLEQFKKNSHL